MPPADLRYFRSSDFDTTTPADAFPDPAHPGQSLHLAKSPLLDQSALSAVTNSKAADLAPLRAPCPLRAPMTNKNYYPSLKGLWPSQRA